MSVTSHDGQPTKRPRRTLHRLTGLLLGTAFPTLALTYVLSLGPVSTALSAAVWCRGATDAVRQEGYVSSGGTTRIDAEVVCRRNGEIFRTLGQGRLWVTVGAAAFVISVLLVVALVLALRIVAAGRRAARDVVA